MKCPNCTDKTLSMTERQGIEIDYCPECRGVWLDRGELDKLMEKARLDASAEANEPVKEQPRQMVQEVIYRDEKYKDDRYKHDYYKHKKKKIIFRRAF